MSTLRVNNLTAVGGTGTITVPTGNQVVQTGAILQVKQTTKLDTFSTTSTSFGDVTGLTVTITPSSTSSKILLIAQLGISMSYVGAMSAYVKFSGGNSGNYIGDAASNRVRTVGNVVVYSNFSASDVLFPANMIYLDSPSTTSATTYSVQMRVNGNTGYVNRSAIDTDSAAYGRGAASITAMEVAG